MSCNASKGAKLLEDWLESDYCKRNNINKDSVAQVVKRSHKESTEIKITMHNNG